MGTEYQNPYPQANDTWQAALQKMAVLYGKWAQGEIAVPGGGSGTVIPENDDQVFSYYGSTNNVQTIVYKLAGAIVATQTYTYKAGGAADDDDVIRIQTTY